MPDTQETRNRHESLRLRRLYSVRFRFNQGTSATPTCLANPTDQRLILTMLKRIEPRNQTILDRVADFVQRPVFI